MWYFCQGSRTFLSQSRSIQTSVRPLYGEYPCKIDPKGRFLVPAALLKLLPEEERTQFVLNKGLDHCLVLYPYKIWEQELEKVYSRNQFIAKNRAFARQFQNGASPAEIDAQNRILIPKRLAQQAGIDKDLVLFGSFDRIEIWSTAQYESWLESQTLDPAELADEIMNDPNHGGH